MTKSRFKRLLAVVVALSLFVCQAVVGFAIDSSYSFPYFSSYSLSVSPDGSSFSRVVSSDSSSPFSSFFVSSDSFSDSVSSFISRLYGASFSTSFYSYHWLGFTPGFYTGFVLISSASSIPILSSMDVGIDPYLYSYNLLTSFDVSYSYDRTSCYIFFTYDIPPDFPSDIVDLYFRFDFSSSFSCSSFSFYPSFLPDASLYPDSSYSSNNIYQSIISGIANEYPALSRNPNNNDMYYFFQWLAQENYNDLSYFSTRFYNMFRSYESSLFSSLNSLTSYLISQRQSQDNNMSGAVPDGLKQQQQEAQNQLTDYEQKEQQIFDNLDTSLNAIDFDQYKISSPSLLSSMSFVNKYVTKGFDGLGDYKIILFLPMVIGLLLSAIGRMGSMMSHMSISNSRSDRSRRGGP